ncbi:MAG: hypothetical protein ACO2PO_17295 [Candidatus Calescibacterium sp.]
METIRKNRIMKKVRLFVVILSLLDVLLLSGGVLAEERKYEEKEWRKNLLIFSFDPANFALVAISSSAASVIRSIQLEYHRGIQENFSIGFEFIFSYLNFEESLVGTTTSLNAWGIGFGLPIGIFFTGNAPEGVNLTFTPTLEFGSVTGSVISEELGGKLKSSGTGFSLPIILGYNFISGREGAGFGLSVGGGVEVFASSSSIEAEAGGKSAKVGSGSVFGISPVFKVGIGIGF